MDDHGDAEPDNDEIIFTPNANFNGAASFDYVLDNGSGDTDTATVAVTVTAVNDAPTAQDDVAEVLEDGVTLNLWSALLGNDGDVDGDPLEIVSVDTAGTLGSVLFDPVTETLVFTADDSSFDALVPGQSAKTSFDYEISDGAGGTSSATVMLTVNGVTEPNQAGNFKGTMGDDQLQGGDADERLSGHKGSDYLNGGAGNDTLNGGSGDDVFAFSINPGADLLTDFDQGLDLLDMRGALNLGTHAEVFDYLDTNNDQVVDGLDDHARASNGRLTIEFDGDGVDGNASDLVEIRHTTSLTIDDFGGI